MLHLKSIVSRSAGIATRQQLSKFVPVTILPSRNYSERHQIPERLKNVATAQGLNRFSFRISQFTHLDSAHFNCDKKNSM